MDSDEVWVIDGRLGHLTVAERFIASVFDRPVCTYTTCESMLEELAVTRPVALLVGAVPLETLLEPLRRLGTVHVLVVDHYEAPPSDIPANVFLDDRSPVEALLEFAKRINHVQTQA